MALRFRRTVKIAPGVRLNLTKTGISARVGPRGAGVTMGTSGTTVSAGLPGTGLHVSPKVTKKPHAITKGTRARTDASHIGKPMGLFGWLGIIVWIAIVIWTVGKVVG